MFIVRIWVVFMAIQKNMSIYVVLMFFESNKANMDLVQSLKFCHSVLFLILEDWSSLWLSLSGPISIAGCQKINKLY